MSSKAKRRRQAASAANAKHAPQVQARYEAAGNGRRLAAWRPPRNGPNAALENFERLQSRARDVARNEWAGEAALTRWQSTLIGTGIVPRFKRVPEGPRRAAVTDLFTSWVRFSDADGVNDFFGQQSLGVRSWLDGGEVFVRERPRDFGSGLPVSMQVQLIESDFCPRFDADAWPGVPRSHTIRSGIQRDIYGDRVNYWMYPEHPGEPNFRQSPASGSLIPIPAHLIRHVYEPKRPGQLRGVPMLAPVLMNLRNMGNFQDTVLDRQNLANLFVAFLLKNIPEGAWGDLDIDPQTGLPKHYDAQNRPLMPMEAGSTLELYPGEDVKFANPPEAGISHSDYVRTGHMGTAAGANIPYELFSGDIRGVSDRTLRVLVLEFRRLARQRQWHIAIAMMCQPIIEWWATTAALEGLIRPREVDAVSRPEWAPQGWEHIHPVQDPQGKILELAAGLGSRSGYIAERGDDRATVDQERADDEASEGAHGLTHVFSAVSPHGETGAGSASTSAPTPAPTPGALQASLGRIARQAPAEVAAPFAELSAVLARLEAHLDSNSSIGAK